MNDSGDLVLVERVPERVRIGDVALNQGHTRALPLRQHELQASVVATEVVADGILAAVEERLERPGADAAEGAGHQRAFSQAARPGRR